MEHKTIVEKYNKGEILIGIDPAMARGFYTQGISGSFFKNWTIKLLLLFEPIALISIVITSIIELKLYSILFILIFVVIYFLFRVNASLKNQGLSTIVSITMFIWGYAIYNYYGDGIVSCLPIITPLPFLCVRLMYRLSVDFFRGNILKSEEMYKVFKDSIILKEGQL